MRIVTPAEAVAGIRSRDQVYVQCAAATPESCSPRSSSARRSSRTSRWSTSTPRDPGRTSRPRWRPTSGTGRCSSAPTRARAVNEGRADFVPVFLSDVPQLFLSGALPLDAVLVNATPPDAHGFCSLGTSVEAMHAAIQAARTVIVQFNAAMPRTLGESFIHVSQIDLAVEVDEPPSTRSTGRSIGDVERRIGAYIADLVPDGATLQLGIGAIPAAAAEFLHGKKDLGVHTEMFSDAVVDLVEAGRHHVRRQGAQRAASW